MSTRNGRLSRYAITAITTAAVTTNLVIAGPTAYAQSSDPPPPPPTVVYFTVGETVQGEAIVYNTAEPNATPTPSLVTIQNNLPKVIDVPSYTLPETPGTFTKKIQFSPYNDPVEQHVLAGDSAGQPLDPSRVRVAYYTKGGEYWVFYPGTGTLERVESWPMVYPSPSPYAQSLSLLFSGPGGPEWLERARQIAVAIAAVVITGGIAAAIGVEAFIAATASVPLW